MPTSHKTDLGLNAWIGSDKPMRADFVSDNQRLDSLLSDHFSDLTAHLSDNDRIQLSQGIVIGTYRGDGSAVRTVALPFVPRAAVVFRVRASVVERAYGKSYYLNNYAVALAGYAAAGAQLSQSTLTVYQFDGEPDPESMADNLNKNGAVYAYALFR